MKKIYPVIIILLSYLLSWSQPKRWTSADIHQGIKKLNVLANAFYVAAHPDDENTRLIALLANQYHANVYYLSMTRGDGGQNLIGPEIEELLGVIRTNELLQARRIDGGNQLFTRANDFGFSKTPMETMKIWNRNEVLSDVVWQIRKYKPDIVINRFSNDLKSETHGQHTTSAVLSTEAFDISNLKDAYPGQLQYVEPWQARRLYFNTFWWFFRSEEEWNKMDKSKLIKMDAGVYYPSMGKSNGEIAGESRSMHRCQGMGAAQQRGSSEEYLEVLKGDVPTNLDNPFAGIDITWNRVKGGKPIIPLVNDLEKTFSYDNPSASIGKLNKIYQAIQALPDTYWKKIKSNEVKTLIEACAGLYIEALSNLHTVTPGDKTRVQVELINRSNANVQLKSIRFPGIKESDTTGTVALGANKPWRYMRNVTIPEDTKLTTAYWLSMPWEQGMYTVNDQKLRGLPLTPHDLKTIFEINIEGTNYTFEKDIVYKWTDPAHGELYRPFEITVPAYVNLDNKVYAFTDENPKKVNVLVRAASDNVNGTLSLALPNGWRTEPKEQSVNIKTKGTEQNYSFLMYAPDQVSEGMITAQIKIKDKIYDKSLITINYDHIPFQTIEEPGEAKVLKLDVKIGPNKIAYINGAGDEIAKSLTQIGYDVNVINPNEIKADNLAKYDAVVVGIRAYNTVDRLKNAQPELMEYVKRGGNLVVQYNTAGRLVTTDLGPYPLKLSGSRVCEENAEMRILKPDHPVMNYPNKISKLDFAKWIQERGLYYPVEWDKDHYEAILSANDTGEKPLDGGLLVTRYGDGNYVYSSLSFFRELPSGVSGAYRLFANLLALKKNPKS